MSLFNENKIDLKMASITITNTLFFLHLLENTIEKESMIMDSNSLNKKEKETKYTLKRMFIAK